MIPRRQRILLGVIAACLLLAGGCDDSQQPGGTLGDYVVSFDVAALTLAFRVEAPSERAAMLQLAVTEVDYDSTAHRLRAWITIHNAGAETHLGPFAVEVFDFAPSGPWPANAGCPPPQWNDLGEPCMFSHYESYGDDRLLSPGETSSPALWIIDDPGDRNFRFRARFWWPHGVACEAPHLGRARSIPSSTLDGSR